MRAYLGVANGPDDRELDRSRRKNCAQSSPVRHPTGPAPSDAPWTNSTFWILQLVVLTLYLIRLAATVAFHLDSTSLVLEFSTLALFVVPVVYATLNFGLQGALFTAGWVTLLAVPRSSRPSNSRLPGGLGRDGRDRPARRAGPVRRSTGHRRARRPSDCRVAQEAHLNAEALYRDLFDSNQAPILIVDGNGYVVETNASAQRAFAFSSSKLNSEYHGAPRFVWST